MCRDFKRIIRNFVVEINKEILEMCLQKLSQTYKDFVTNAKKNGPSATTNLTT